MVEYKSSVQLIRHILKFSETMARDCCDAGPSGRFAEPNKKALGRFWHTINDVANVFSEAGDVRASVDELKGDIAWLKMKNYCARAREPQYHTHTGRL